MTSDLWNIFLNIVAAIIYAGLVWLWQNRGTRPTILRQPVIPSVPTHTDDLDRRARKRHALEVSAQAFMFYLVTFAVLYLSITMPPLFKALFSKSQILLSQARYVGEFLPSVPVGKDYLQISFFVVAAFVYWPLLALAEVTASLIYPLVDAVWPVTQRIWYAMKMLLSLAFCIPVAATSIWLFYEKSYTDALQTVLLAMFIAFAVGQAQGGQK